MDWRSGFNPASVGVATMLCLAAIALIGPWNIAPGSSPVAGAFAALMVLMSYGLTIWGLGKARISAPTALPATAPDLGPIIDRLDRLIAAVEARPSATAAIPGHDLAAIVAAIAGQRWAEAEAMLAAIGEHPEAGGLADRLGGARREAGDRLGAELKAAQDVGDADRVLEVHDGLRAVLPAEARDDLDSRVAKWFLALIMKRLRGGTVRPDVAELAARVADRFSRNLEGASLRASLPTLRRSAGLCPRCSAPYRGIADACPKCLAPPPPPGPPAPEPSEDDGLLAPGPRGDDDTFIDPLDPA